MNSSVVCSSDDQPLHVRDGSTNELPSNQPDSSVSQSPSDLSADLSISQSIDRSIDHSINQTDDNTCSSSFMRDTLQYAINLLKQTDDDRLIIDQIKATIKMSSDQPTNQADLISQNSLTKKSIDLPSDLPPLSDSFAVEGLLDERELLDQHSNQIVHEAEWSRDRIVQQLMSINEGHSSDRSKPRLNAQPSKPSSSRLHAPVRHSITYYLQNQTVKQSIDQSNKRVVKQTSSQRIKQMMLQPNNALADDLIDPVKLTTSTSIQRTSSLPASGGTKLNHPISQSVKTLTKLPQAAKITRAMSTASIDRLSAPRIRPQSGIQSSKQYNTQKLNNQSNNQSIKPDRALKPMVRFSFILDNMIALRGDRFKQSVNQPIDQRVDSLEWMSMSSDGDLISTVTSMTLHNRSSELTTVLVDASALVGDLDRDFCFQVWSHSRDVDSICDDDDGPQHEMLYQFVGTVIELARACQPPVNKSSDPTQHQQPGIHDLFVAVDVVLHDAPKKNQSISDKQSVAKSCQDLTIPTDSLRLSITQLSNTLIDTNDSTNHDFVDLILPESVFIRRHKLQIAQVTRQHSRRSSRDSLQNSRTSSIDYSIDGDLDLSRLNLLNEQVDDCRINNSDQSINQLDVFVPRYFRVNLSVMGLPNMKFDGLTDSYFEVLLLGDSTLHSLYRSEVQFDTLQPCFLPFVLSSVRDEDMNRSVVVRVHHWRHRSSAKEVIGECHFTLRHLIPSESYDQSIPSLSLDIHNATRVALGMKNACVGKLHFDFVALFASPVSVDTAPCTFLKSDRQLVQHEAVRNNYID